VTAKAFLTAERADAKCACGEKREKEKERETEKEKGKGKFSANSAIHLPRR
jgi:hypothetical protein